MAVHADPAGQLSTTTSHETDAAGADQVSPVDAELSAPHRLPTMRWPIVSALVILVAMGGLFGWLGYRAYETRQAQQQRDLFLQVGRTAALNLTTISAAEADADVARILDSAVGAFHDEFAERAPAFVEVVKKAQAKTEGSVTAAGLESEQPDQAQVLVAVSVKTSNAGAPEQQPRAWRMRITVQKVGDSAKAAKVVFVP